MDELEEELGNVKSLRRRRISRSSDRDSSTDSHDRKVRTRAYATSRSGYPRIGGGGGGGRRNDIENMYKDNEREDLQYSEEDENKHDVRRNQISKNGRIMNNQNNVNNQNNGNNQNIGNNQGNGNNSNNNNSNGNNNSINRSNSNTNSAKGNNNRNAPSATNRDEIEETLAMQTMSLIHGQLTAMKQQLLTISDAPPLPPPPTSSSFSSDNYTLDISVGANQSHAVRPSHSKSLTEWLTHSSVYLSIYLITGLQLY